MHVALVTGGGSPLDYDPDAPLVVVLERRGATVSRPRWDDPDQDWAVYDLAVVRTTWDYTARRDTFVAWAAETAQRTRLWNPADVLRWNTHKAYLLELEERGAPVVPTAWLGAGDRLDLAALLAQRGWPRAVLKPAVGAGSDGLARVEVAAPAAGSGDATDPGTARRDGWRPGAPVPARPVVLDVAAAQQHLDALLAVGDALVQPYLHAIEAEGELSVVVIAGEVTHAVRKQPAAGDFRVQEEFGARSRLIEPDPEVAALARWVVDATGAELLFARVDLVVDADGTPQVVELEATEPDLFLTLAPEAAERLADAVLARGA